MYSWPDQNPSRELSCLDNRQLGIMICFILRQDLVENESYHTFEPSAPEGSFLGSLLKEGDYNTDKYTDWTALDSSLLKDQITYHRYVIS